MMMMMMMISNKLLWSNRALFKTNQFFETYIFGDGFIQNISTVAAIHGDLMFEPVLTDITQEPPEVLHFVDRNASIHPKRISGKFPFSQIGSDFRIFDYIT